MEKKFFTSQKNVFFIILPAVIIFLDQFCKYKIRQTGGFYICNKGISFGLHLPYLKFWLICTYVLGTWLILKLFKKHLSCDTYTSLGIIFLFSGAFSNIIDRLAAECVTDYLSFFQPTFPLFNLADVFIFIGSILLAAHFLTFTDQKVNKK